MTTNHLSMSMPPILTWTSTPPSVTSHHHYQSPTIDFGQSNIHLFRGPTFTRTAGPFSSPQIDGSSISQLSTSLAFSTPNVKNIVTTVLTTAEDYLPWRTQFESFLVSHGLLGMIDGTVSMSSLYVLDAYNWETMNPEYTYWLRIDQNVRSWIFATLSKETLVDVHDVQYSSKIWERLQVRFMSAGLARSMELKRSLSMIIKSEDQSMENYLRQIKLIAVLWQQLTLQLHPMISFNIP